MDTAFELCECVVPCIKKESGRINSDDILFNQTIAKPRVRSEHLNGILKSRFPGIMRKIRKIITDDKESLREILECIDCAVILHNMLIDANNGVDDDGVEDEWLRAFYRDEDLSDIDDPHRGDPDEVRTISREEHALNSRLPIGSPKDVRRTQLKNYIREQANVSRRDSSDEDMSFDGTEEDV